MSLTSLAARHLASPWVRHHDFNGAAFIIAARSHLRFGWLLTGGVDVWNDGVGAPVELHRYLNHPPLIVWMIALPMSVLGMHERVARLIVLVPVLAGLVALYLPGGLPPRRARSSGCLPRQCRHSRSTAACRAMSPCP